MQVNAINSFSTQNNLGFEGKKSKEQKYNDTKWQTLEQMQASEEKRSRALRSARNYALGAMLAAGTLTSCEDLYEKEVNFNHEHYFPICCPVDTAKKGDTVYIKEYIPGETVYVRDTQYVDKLVPVPQDPDTVMVRDTIVFGPDTVFVDKPVVKVDTLWVEDRDTIFIDKPIYIPGDTVYVMPNFESEVADTILNDFGTLDIDTAGKGIPVNMKFYDEWETSVNNLMFNGRESSVGTLVYDNTTTDWYDDKMYSRIEFSIAKGKGLIAQVKTARNPHEKPENKLDWVPFKTYLFQNVGNKINKFEQKENGELKYIGTFTKGDKAQSIFNNTDLPNGEVETWRYADWKVKRHDVHLDDLYNDYIEAKSNASKPTYEIP